MFGAEEFGKPERNFEPKKKLNVITVSEFSDLMDKIFEPFEKDKGDRKKRFSDAPKEKLEQVIKKIEEKGKKLGDLISFSYGLKTGDDSKFLFNYKKNDDCKKLLRSKNIGR